MNIQDLFDTVKESLSSVAEKITDFVSENKKLALIVSALGLSIVICLILLIVSLSSTNSKKSKTVEIDPLVLSEPLLIPDGPEIPRDYNLSRENKTEWSDIEAKEWFTIPNVKEIESLSKINQNMVNEIIGAAP